MRLIKTMIPTELTSAAAKADMKIKTMTPTLAMIVMISQPTITTKIRTHQLRNSNIIRQTNLIPTSNIYPVVVKITIITRPVMMMATILILQVMMATMIMIRTIMVMTTIMTCGIMTLTTMVQAMIA